ncbi:helix-turn-helix domain-containing protein [Streptomyces sp. NPDC013178]|uniref:PucR family transcriptional regulator n=1 Tax=Streptomyces sp. NPDC013178 TaxID=3155118 RepID=UPI0033FAA4A1
MRSIFDSLRAQIEANARNSVDIYFRQLPEYRGASNESRLRADVLDFAVFIRRRSVDLAEGNQTLSADDLASIAAAGRQRGAEGFSPASQESALSLHTSLMLREITEVPQMNDIDGLVSMVGWFSSQAGIARNAYVLGYEEQRTRLLSAVDLLQSVAKKLLTDEPTAPELLRILEMPVPKGYAVTVVRTAAPPRTSGDEPYAALIESLVQRHRVPLLWEKPTEFVALIPTEDMSSLPRTDRALSVARGFGALVDRPCVAGMAVGGVGALAEAVALARRISSVAPMERELSHVFTLGDVFVELGLAQQPQVDGWLNGLTKKLLDGPNLVSTLDAFYRADMSRLRTAALLHIHPRTLDYRLQRVRALTGVDPASVRGVRILTAAVTRMRTGAWE